MQHKVNLTKLLVIFAAILCGALLLCEVMRIQAGNTAIQYHQKHWDCLATEGSKVPACVALTKAGPPEDADFCRDAVAICKANGVYESVVFADVRLFMWERFTRLLRLVVCTSAVCSLLWFALIRPICRTMVPRGIDR